MIEPVILRKADRKTLIVTRAHTEALIRWLRTEGFEDTSPDAFRAGDIAVKCNSDDGDGHGDGARCTVVFAATAPQGASMVFVRWDDMPDDLIGIAPSRLRRAT